MVVKVDIGFILLWKVGDPRYAVRLGNDEQICGTENEAALTSSGLKLGVRGTMASGKRFWCLAAGIGGVVTIE